MHAIMKAFRGILLALLFLLPACAYYNTLFNAKKSYEKGVQEILKSPDTQTIPPQARKYFQTTIDKCWKLIDIYSDKSKYADDALLYIARSEYYLGKLAAARDHLEKFLQKYPDSDLVPEAHLWLGKVLLKDEKFDEAREHMLFAITHGKTPRLRSEANFELGKYAFDHQDYEAAGEYFQKAMKEKPDKAYRALLKFYMGETFFIQKRYLEAIKQYREVEKFKPTVDIEYRTRYHLAQSYIETGKYDRAEELLRKMLTAPRFKPYIPYIKNAMARIQERQHHYPEAIEIYKEVLQLRSRNAGVAQAAFSLGRIYETVFNNVDSAVTYYGKVRRIDSKYDSVEIAEKKKVFLGGLKTIRDAIKYESWMVHKLRTDPYFRDSLYRAQYLDSLRKLGILSDTTLLTRTHPDSLHRDSLKADSTRMDSLRGQQQARRNEPRIEEEKPSSRQQDREEEENAKKQTQERKSTQKPVEVERRRLPQLEHDLMTHRFQLAEYYLLKVENLDSAAHYFWEFLKNYRDSVLTPKALYALSFIYQQPGHRDSALADSLERAILDLYPHTPFAQAIQKKRGLMTTKEKNPLEEWSHRLYLNAESHYFNGNVDSALVLYRQIVSRDTVTEWGAKAQLSIAWIYEHRLKDNQKALLAYQDLVRQFPQFDRYVAFARRKINPVINGQKAASTRAPQVQKATSEEAAGGEQSRKIAPAEITSGNLLHNKILWRKMRRKRR